MTERQQREIEYHAHHALILCEEEKPSYEVLGSSGHKWWNHYWCAIKAIRSALLENRAAEVLVPGCGEGFDARVLAKCGARITACDISPEMLALARERAETDGLHIEFRCMPAEAMDFPNESFDLIFIRDLLHHCDVERATIEAVRLLKRKGAIVIDELYTHTLLQRMRESRAGKVLYSVVRRIIYRGQNPYITDDERKLNEDELSAIVSAVGNVRLEYFNAVVNRLIPDWDVAAIADTLLMFALGPLRRFVAGRVLICARKS